MVYSLHILFAGVWIGCVLTETVFEKSLVSEQFKERSRLARLHLWVDTMIEIPALIGTAITGALFVRSVPLDLLLSIKLVSASLTLIANLLCFVFVVARDRAAVVASWGRFEQHDHRQHQFGKVVFIGVLLTALLGLIH